MGIQRLRDAESRDILQIIDPSYSDQFSLFQVPALSLDMQDMQKNDEDEEDREDDKPEDAEIYGDYE